MTGRKKDCHPAPRTVIPLCSKTGSRSYQRFSHCCSLPLTTHHTPLTTAPIIPHWFSLRRAVHRPGAWTRPWREREEERERESERKERAKMGTDRLLWSVPDFRSSASRDLALTNDFRTVALYHSLLTTHHSQPLLSSHIGSRSKEPSIFSRPGAWTRPWREREEERERESERKERARRGEKERE